MLAVVAAPLGSQERMAQVVTVVAVQVLEQVMAQQ
jgi:hypothetical protein